jgi:hypothetical protein
MTAVHIAYCHNLSTEVYGKRCDNTTALGATGTDDRRRSYGKETSQWLRRDGNGCCGKALTYVAARDFKRKTNCEIRDRA